MWIHYRRFRFQLDFSRPVLMPFYPSFLIRSLLGKELRRMCCLLRDRSCERCSLGDTCVHARLFETPISKHTPMLPGRDHASHPFVLSCPGRAGERMERLDVALTLIGQARAYIPHVYFALKKAGQAGAGPERIPFVVTDVTSEGESLLRDSGEQIDVPSDAPRWELATDGAPAVDRVVVRLASPVRLKVRGRYATSLTAEDLMDALERRLALLAALYGDGAEAEERRGGWGLEMGRCELSWVEPYHYSARQRRGMRLGGLVGSMEIFGPLGGRALSLLRGGERFHVGKNPSFGLGRIEMELPGGGG